jgi:hypothetical protein
MEPGSGRGGPRLGLAIPGIAEASKAKHRYRPRGGPGDGSGNRRAALDVVDKLNSSTPGLSRDDATRRADPPAMPGLLDELKHDGFSPGSNNAVRHAAFGRPPFRELMSWPAASAQVSISGERRNCLPLHFGENAKFFCAQVARASAASGGGPEGQLGRFDDGGGSPHSCTRV